MISILKHRFETVRIVAVARFFAISAAVAVFVACGILAAPFFWFTLRYGVPEILSGSLKYDWNVVYAGGGFDQFGLTKLVICIFATEMFIVLGRFLFVKLSQNRIWRICVNTLSIAALIVPLIMSIYCAWELSRYIAVMGVTSDRIAGVRWVILFIFIAAYCTVKWIAGQITLKKHICMIAACLLAACTTFFAVDAAACRAVASHPRPQICCPNGVAVPDVPETSTSYGLTELLFRVRQKGIK
jgi:hypothetical protein